MWPGVMPPCDHYTKELFVSGSCTVRNGSFSPNCPCSNDANDDTATWWSPSRHRSKCTTAHSSLDNNTFPLYDAPFRWGVCARETCTLTEPGRSSENCYEPDSGKRTTKKIQILRCPFKSGRLLKANRFCVSHLYFASPNGSRDKRMRFGQFSKDFASL